MPGETIDRGPTDEEGTILVRIARNVIEHRLGLREALDGASPRGSLEKPAGAFVTLWRGLGKERELRGCVGLPSPDQKLIDAMVIAAQQAAFVDPRFPPVERDEMPGIWVEVSVLTHPELIRVKNPIQYPSVVRLGIDGLIVERNGLSGLLLPQVPLEWNWNTEEFLSNTCLKAGLPPDSWLVEGTRVFRFQSVIFAEEGPEKRIVRVSQRTGTEG